MTKKYYFVTTLLPSLQIGSIPELGSRELSHILEENLSSKDLKEVEAIRRVVDMENLRLFWQKRAFNPGGTYTENDFEECFFWRERLPEYVLAYVEKYPSDENKIAHFSELFETFFRIEQEEKHTSFVKEYIRFEWEWRQALVFLRARTLEYDMRQKIGETEDPFLEELLRHKDDTVFEMPEGFTPLKTLYEQRKHSPLDLHQGIEEWRFNHIADTIRWKTFSLSRILGYVAQLAIVETWLELDRKKGLHIIDRMMTVSK